jgi:putative hemolysin
MSDGLWLESIAILILVGANGFFVLAEFSIIASRMTRLRERLRQKKFGAASALKLRDNPEHFLAAIQVGITLFGALLGVFSGATIIDKMTIALGASQYELVAQFARPLSLVIVTLIITILSVIFGELVPKYIALANPEKYAGAMSPVVSVFISITSIFAKTFSWIARGIVRVGGIKKLPLHDHVSEEEINQMIVEGAEKGIFDSTEQQLIKSVFKFSDSNVRRAMRPRTDVTGIEQHTNIDDIRKMIVSEGYSRYPVFDKTIDHVIGILNVKDLLRDLGSGQQPESFSSYIRPPLFVPESMPLATLLLQFRRGKNHMAIVLDEFGGTAGIVTLEDVLEELVGEIQDEYDAEQPSITKHSDQVAYVEGHVWPGEVNNLIGTNLPVDDVDTIAGLYMEEAGKLPQKHESITIADAILTVLATEKNRIVRLKVERVSEAESEGE